MTPLALIIQAGGGRVEGSDRALDQGRNTERFDFLRGRGDRCFTRRTAAAFAAPSRSWSPPTAVEETVPDVLAARRVGATITTRAKLLAELFNRAAVERRRRRHQRQVHDRRHDRLDPRSRRQAPDDHERRRHEELHGRRTRRFASARVGDGDIFVSEVDESDGSIAYFEPRVAVVNNISLDHKSLDELRALFRDFVAKAQTVVLNLDNAETAALAGRSEARTRR